MRMPRRVFGETQGSSLVELAFVLPVLMVVLLGIIDFGRVFYTSAEVANAAHAGAIYGSRTLSLANSTTGMQTAATTDAADTTGMTSTASVVCECTQGGSVVICQTAQSSCGLTIPLVYVTVTTSAKLTPLVPWPGIPNPITVNATAKMRAQ
jgi:Flp pilus assembly protein TadG